MEISYILIIAILIILILLKKYIAVKKELQNKDKKFEELNNSLYQQQMENGFLNKKMEELELFQKEFKQLKDDNSKLNIENRELATKLDIFDKVENELKDNIIVLKEEISQLREIKTQLEVENQELKTKLEQTEKSNSEKIDILLKAEEKLKDSFENLANQILDQTNEKMVKDSQLKLSEVLTPLQNQMKEFKEKIENLNKDEFEKLTLLQQELKQLKEVSFRLSSEAENLTKALKGEAKTQGNWGELVLERVLELSGLEKGREYEREVNLSDGENRYRPDVIVHLPNDRDVIIDAKTSLNAYQEYIKTEDKIYIKSHIQAIKNHIDNLANKRYENLKGVNSLDFVFMFVPIENALMLALENDLNLFEYAFKQKVVLVSPTTLLVSLRAIESSWRFERQAKNIEEIVKTAENLYDKVRLFSEDFDKIGKSLEVAQKSYESGKKRLTDGRGSLLRQVDILKEKSGIKPKKEIGLLKN